MVQRKPVTSEKQLLSLIENPEGVVEIKARAAGRKSFAFLSPVVWREKFFFFRR